MSGHGEILPYLEIGRVCQQEGHLTVENPPQQIPSQPCEHGIVDAYFFIT